MKLRSIEAISRKICPSRRATRPDGSTVIATRRLDVRVELRKARPSTAGAPVRTSSEADPRVRGVASPGTSSGAEMSVAFEQLAEVAVGAASPRQGLRMQEAARLLEVHFVGGRVRQGFPFQRVYLQGRPGQKTQKVWNGPAGCESARAAVVSGQLKRSGAKPRGLPASFPSVTGAAAGRAGSPHQNASKDGPPASAPGSTDSETPMWPEPQCTAAAAVGRLG